KAARNARGPLEVLADDPAFPVDFRAWCHSAGAASESLPSPAGLYRVRVFPKGLPRDRWPATIPVGAAAPAPSPRPPAASPPSTPTASFDLRAVPNAEGLEEELAHVGRLRPGTALTLVVPPFGEQRALKWCIEGGHELRGYAGGGRIDLVLGHAPAG